MNNNKKFYVYIHFKKDTLEPFYIGKGTKNRHNISRGRNRYWCNVVEKHGFVSDILQYFDTELEAFEYEKEMIKFFIENGYKLTNMTDGGEGLSGFTHRPETKAKIGNANRGVPKPTRTAKHRENMSIAKTGVTKSDACKAKLRTIAANRVGDKSHNFKGAVIATNMETGEQLRLCGKKAILEAGFAQPSVSACVLGKMKSHRGYTFYRESVALSDN